MIIEIHLKDPDALIEALQQTFEKENFGLDEDEAELIRDKRIEKMSNYIIENWVEYGEYYVILIDTELNTATLKPNKK